MVDLIQSVDIEAPMEVVWAEITKLGSVQRAMMDTILRTTLEPGAPLRYTTRDGKRVFIVGRIVEVEPPRTFSHTYRMLTRDDPETLVTWELEAIPTGTRVTVRHTGWPDGTKRLKSVDSTWASILVDLRSQLERGDITTSKKLQYVLMRSLMWMMPARTKTENVTD
jgi:uncharacterized protein YndB with AHSA1/START domain